MPKYIAGVIALRASGRSSVHTPNGPSRVKRRYGVPRQPPSGGRGGGVVVIGVAPRLRDLTRPRRWAPRTARHRPPRAPAAATNQPRTRDATQLRLRAPT